MEIKKKYFDKYLHEIAIEQIAEDYINKGYQVKKEKRLGIFCADIVASKGEEQLVIEIKTGKITPDQKQKISGIADYIRSRGNYKFLVVIATPPKEKKLIIQDIEHLITEYIHNNLPSELDELSSHTRPDEVNSIDIDEVNISEGKIFVKGNGVVSVELQFGSDGDQIKGDGLKSYDNFPFEFEISLTYNSDNVLEIVDVEKFKVDTSSYFEN